MSAWIDQREKLIKSKSICKLKVAGRRDDDACVYAYYVPLWSPPFRHRGQVGADGYTAPPHVVLYPPHEMRGGASQPVRLQGKMALYCSSSGTGKTVELAGTSYTRNTMLSFLMRLDDTADMSGVSWNIRNVMAITVLQDELACLLKEYKQVLEAVLTCSVADEERKISICIDEASTCPFIVRSIIADLKNAEKAVQAAIKDVFKNDGELVAAAADNLAVVFSAGGTGASGDAAIGSTPENFEHLVTSASLKPEALYNTMLLETAHETLQTTYTFAKVSANPLLKVMVEGNARMTSIFVAQLESMGDKPFDPRQLLENTLERFRESNALNGLTTTMTRCKAASQALAIFLFQEAFRTGQDHAGLDRMEYHGVKFDKAIRPFPSRDLVAKFGLLEPAPLPTKNRTVKKPFLLPPAMQLMVLYLMGFSSVSPLEELSFGFEALSTQMIKCAIASALTMPRDSRPNLKSILVEKLNFQLPCPKADHLHTQEVKDWWNSLSSMTPVRCKTPKTEFIATRKQRAQATIREKLKTGESYKTKRCLFFEEELGDELKDLRSLSQETDDNDGFCPPICSIACGSSDLVDGYVTFFAAKRTPEEGEQSEDELGIDEKSTKEVRPFKMTILNQAKDYHNSTLDNTALKLQAQKCGYDCLQSLFGRRLYCVASKEEAWQVSDAGASTATVVPRAYLGFDVSRSELLGKDVAALGDTRNQKLQDLLNGKDFSWEDGHFREYLGRKSVSEINKLTKGLDAGKLENKNDKESFLVKVENRIKHLQQQTAAAAEEDQTQNPGMLGQTTNPAATKAAAPTASGVSSNMSTDENQSKRRRVEE